MICKTSSYSSSRQQHVTIIIGACRLMHELLVTFAFEIADNRLPASDRDDALAHMKLAGLT